MGMEINGNFSGYAVRKQNDNSYMSQGMTESTRKRREENMSQTSAGSRTEGASEISGGSKAQSRTDYMNNLKKLAPSVEFRIGYTHAADKSGETLTIHPKLLEKMQNNPETEKEMKELIAGVEKMTKISEAFNKATGWTTVFRHSYIDENGNYCHIALIRNDYMLNLSDKLREERRKNAEKLMEKQKENAIRKREELEEVLEEKSEEKVEEKVEVKIDINKIETLLQKKIAASEDGILYMDNSEFKTILEAVNEDNTEKADKKEQVQVGANLDLQV